MVVQSISDNSKNCISADKIYLNGKILTMDSSDSIAEAIAVTQSKVQAVGETYEIRALISHKTEVFDLGGKPLMSSFIDSYSHFPSSGEMETRVINLY